MFLTASGAIATFFAGAVTVLWRVIEKYHQNVQLKATELDEKNTKLNSEMHDVKHQVGLLQGRQDGIEKTCELTLSAVRNAILDRDSPRISNDDESAGRGSSN